MFSSQDAKAMAERFQVALDLFATGEALFRQRIRRENPELTLAQVEERVILWLRTRPGAENGDAVGQPGSWPRNVRR